MNRNTLKYLKLPINLIESPGLCPNRLWALLKFCIDVITFSLTNSETLRCEVTTLDFSNIAKVFSVSLSMHIIL